MLQILDRLLFAAGAVLTTGTAGGLACATALGFFNPGAVDVPPPLDYARPAAWAAHPNTVDHADFAPTGYRDRQSESAADAFFVYGGAPSGSEAFFAANLDPRDRRPPSKPERAMRNQASLFNCCARVFAPHYRLAVHTQAPTPAGEAIAGRAISTQRAGDAAGSKRTVGFDLAYSDVREAFRQYLRNENGGRPLILAGHGQGSRHAIRLLREFYPQIRGRLVAAYLLGAPVPVSAFHGSQAAEELEPCDRDDRQTGCFVSFTVQAGGADQARLTRTAQSGVPAHCVNPLTWRADDHEIGPAAWHQGALAPVDQFRHEFRNSVQGDAENHQRGRGAGIRPALSDASCVNGRLLVQAAAARKYGPYANNGAEYGLFYLDLRLDVAERLRRFSRRDLR